MKHVIKIKGRYAVRWMLARDFSEIKIQLVLLLRCSRNQQKAEVLKIAGYCRAEYGPNTPFEDILFHKSADVRVICISGVDYARLRRLGSVPTAPYLM